jgi:hypothetical protein
LSWPNALAIFRNVSDEGKVFLILTPRSWVVRDDGSALLLWHCVYKTVTTVS